MQPMATTAADNVAKRCPNCNSSTTGMVGDDDGNQFCHGCGNVWSDSKAIKVEATDSIAKRCPNCNSSSTGMLGDDEGHMRCHSCMNIWKHPGVIKVETKTAAPAQQANPVGVPAAEQHAPLNHGGDEDSSLTWEDTTGEPLQANQEYEMHNPGFQIPDMVRVKQVKPDGLEIELLGTYANEPNGLKAPATVSKEEKELQHLTFEPIAQNADEHNPEAPAGTPGHEQIPPSGQTTDERANSQPISASANSCPRCGHDDFNMFMSSATTTMHDCYRCGHSWETKEEMDSIEANAAAREWIKEDDDPLDFVPRAAAGTPSRDLSSIAAKDTRLQAVREVLENNKRISGKHFTPSEQRTLIDEDGTARNSDLLDLEGTHYRTRDSFDSKVNPDNVPESHFMLGL